MMARYDKEENDETYGAINKPPMVQETLEKELRFLRQKLRGKFPSEIPREYGSAALWWMSRQKPANDNTERPRQVAVTGKQAARWINPYADRLVSSLRTFCRLKPNERDFVLAAAQDGVWYNGDDFDFFRRVYDETMRMQEIGVFAYRAEATKKLKGLMRGIA